MTVSDVSDVSDVSGDIVADVSDVYDENLLVCLIREWSAQSKRLECMVST